MKTFGGAHETESTHSIRNPSSTASTYRSLSDPSILLAPSEPAVPSDISCLFSIPPEASETRQLAIELQKSWREFELRLYHHLEYTLTYAPPSKLRSAVLYCSTSLERFAVWNQEGFDRITCDPRYRDDVYVVRQRRCASSFMFAECEAMELLRCCYNVATRIAQVPALDKLRELWFAALSRSAARLRWLPVSSAPLG